MGAWGLVVPLVEQSSGRFAEQSGRMASGLVLIWRPPFVVRYRPAEQARSLAYSGDALAVLIVVGTMVFAAGDHFARLPAPLTPSPVPYALAFFTAALSLASLSKLAQRTRQTSGGSVVLAEGSIGIWLGTTLAVLITSATAGVIMPGKLITVPVQRAGQALIHQLRYDKSKPDQGQAARQAQSESMLSRQSGSRPKSHMKESGLIGNLPDSLRGSAAAVTDRVMEAALRIATLFETPPTQEETDSASPSAVNQPAGRSTGAGVTGDHEKQAPKKKTKSETLMQALSEKHVRIAKLAAAAAFLGIAAWFVAIFVRRYLLKTLVRLARLASHCLAAAANALTAPLRTRLAAIRRQMSIAHLIRVSRNPFEDPFEAETGLTPEALAGAAFATLTAYAWLLGFERRGPETACDFAHRMCRSSLFNPQAIWTVVNACVRSAFSGAHAPETEVEHLHAALQHVRERARAEFTPEQLQAREMAYRRLLAISRMSG